LIKALIEFINGRNIVLLMPENQLIRKKIFKNYLWKIVELKHLGEVKFIKNGK
jgi:hypothetical protein